MNDVEMQSRMELDWDARACEAPEFYIATAQREWSAEEFFRSGEITVENEILADPLLFEANLPLSRMRMLEIGCGAGRMTRTLAGSFGAVDAVDVSGEMIRLAKLNLADCPNVSLHKNNGSDLARVADSSCDLAFSFIVFQHIPSREVIESYVREVFRVLKPGAVFKFQVSGAVVAETSQSDASHYDTWFGTAFSSDQALALAMQGGFDLIHSEGASTQYFWLWLRKPGPGRQPDFWSDASPVPVRFEPARIMSGDSYRVHVPGFENHTIDIGWELLDAKGVVGRWCSLDSNGEATIPVPEAHPAGIVRISRVRSRTAGGQWRRASGSIEILQRYPADDI